MFVCLFVCLSVCVCVCVCVCVVVCLFVCVLVCVCLLCVFVCLFCVYVCVLGRGGMCLCVGVSVIFDGNIGRRPCIMILSLMKGGNTNIVFINIRHCVSPMYTNTQIYKLQVGGGTYITSIRHP